MATTYESEGPLPSACVRLERDLAGFLDGTLEASGTEWVAEHLESCARCAALLDALDEPSAVGRAVAALPSMRAPGHLWDGVAARIAAPVVEIGRLQRRAPSAERVSRPGWWRTGLAAAGLVLLTAGVTYTLTVRQHEHATPAPIATTTPSVQPNAAPTPTTEPAPSTQVATVDAAPTTAPPRSTVTTVSNRSALGARRSPLPADPTRDTYDREIAKLRVVLSQRSGELDTATVRILTRNMKVIDQAIAQSKAALARDPASGFLNKQLNNALDQKLELLRTAALLPVRT